MSGKIYDNVTSDGMKYSIYIPDNYNSNTPILSYNLSTGVIDNNSSSVWINAKNAVLEQGYDNVVLFPNHYDTDTWNKDYQNNSIAILNDAKEKYGLTSDLFMTTGFSSCCSQSVKTTAEYIRQNPGVERQVAFTLDGFIWKNGVLNQSELDALIRNDTLFVSYCQPQNWNKLSSAVTENLDILIITDKNEYINHETSYWGRHDLIASNFFVEGLYNDVLNFLDGRGTLNISRYNFYVVNECGRKVQVTDPKQLYSLLGINTIEYYKNKFLGISDYKISSDQGNVAYYLNRIRRLIRKSSFLERDFSLIGCTSTTSVPSEILSYVRKYFTDVSKNLDKIISLTDTVASIHTAYVRVDDELSSTINS